MIPLTLTPSLSDRVTSGFPLSIATSLAMESLFPPRQAPFDTARKIPNKVDISKYQEIYVNLSTLFRNISSAVTKEVFLHASPQELADVIQFEIEVIDSLLSNEGNGLCKAVYYFCTYDKLYTGKTGGKVKLREDKTDNQKFYKYKLMKTMELVLKDSRYLQFDVDIKGESKNSSIMITHVPYDLVSYTNFNKLMLLESHTGILKPRHLWYTKYYPIPGADLSHISFNRKLLLVFGDKILIHPSDTKLRRMILEIAKNRNWTAMTTDAKIMLDFSIDVKEPFVLDYLRSL